MQEVIVIDSILDRYFQLIMKQKLQSFKKEIRRQQINNYFVMRREEQNNPSNNREIVFAIEEEKKTRRAVPTKIQVQIQSEHPIITEKFQQKCTDLSEFCKLKEYNEVVMLLKQLLKDIKKIIKQQQNGQKCDGTVDIFLRSNLLTVVIDCLIKATAENINRGILQEISKNALSILNYSIHMAPLVFTQNLFLNSNIIPFLCCSITEPQLDYDHIDKMIIILTHMVIVSVSSTGKLFNLLNSKESKFHISAIFFNISRMNLKPGLPITQNFIILMKHYLYKIEYEHISNLKYDSQAQPNTCLQKYQIDILGEIVVTSINQFDINMYDNQGAQALVQMLDVCRILMEYFKMSEKYKFRLNYRKLTELLTFKNTPTEIKSIILCLLDHIIYQDQQGDLTYFLVSEGGLVSVLWMLREQYYNYTMNMFCNLALNKETKPFLNPYAHNIFTGLKYSKGDKMVWNFAYNWFSSQNFEIIQSRDKLVVELIRDSEQTNEHIIEIQCMFWYKLLLHQNIIVPQRILKLDNPIALEIKQKTSQSEEYSL